MPPKMRQLTCLQTLQLFKVGLERSSNRRIRSFEKPKREEARTAHLQEKSNIYKLAYVWFHDEPEGSETNDEYVLDGRLLPNLVRLKLSGCKRCKEIPSLGQLKLLRHLELSKLHKVECIGPTFYGKNIGSSSNIQVFPSLKELVLKSMSSLIEWKGNEVGVRMFPRLEKLTITACPLLKSTPSQFEILRELEIFMVDSEMPLLNLCNNVSLQTLTVSGCRELRKLPQSLYNLHSLKSLQIHFCPNFSSFPVPSGENYLTSLRSLELWECDGLTSLPSGMLEHCRSLGFLRVSCCNNLVSFPLHVWEMPSLFYLGLSNCPKFISVPAGSLQCLTGLRVLEIGPLSEMMDFEAFQLIFNGIQQLLSFRNLRVSGHGHWDSLPHQLMQLSALKGMGINDFGIEALPDRLDNLTSLETLHLVSCKRLQHLDFSYAMPKLWYVYIHDCPLLEALSDGLSNLVSLEELSCLKLEESCNNRSGPNSQWSNISHIPKIKVTSSKVMIERLYGDRLEHFASLVLGLLETLDCMVFEIFS
ncbi:hypothetical protein H5410_053296 [Solanum commersonii]|uniref:Disease resistance protein At4g27190-like leucine-rich repeats domain-containing protein n=1 Tax=Solanum commersonii TaxID=4109 RepID=A0A9J5X5J3_SOLCO|nr:hypothetical protein H5410_053296 [Solanum commersonii]